ncbi:MAG: ribosome silencing factor [Deinococcales bacterium]|nr:ribosome silencing factor [Chitinophagaceae bacterium]
MSQLSVLETRPKGVTKVTRNSKFFKGIITSIKEKKGEHIISLDLRKIPEAVADFFIICEASSTTQVKAIADFIEYNVKEICGEVPYKHEGKTTSQWILIDYISIVVHVMHPEQRKFYNLEDMWSDAVSQGYDD